MKERTGDSEGIDRITRRIVEKAGIPGLVDLLASRISASDLQSLLIATYSRRAKSVKPSTVLAQYRTNRFVKIAHCSPADSSRFDSMAFSLLPRGFEAVELSPVSPFCASSALGPVDQNKVISTIRNTEVCSDSTNALALECAVRRAEKRDVKTDTKLCASHRLVRAQRFDGPGLFPHFRVLCLCSAGRNRGNFEFEAESAIEHADYYVRVIKAAREAGFHAGRIRVRFTPLSADAADVASRIIARELSERHADTEFETADRTTTGYYRFLRFNISVSSADGEELGIVDGGFTDWMEKLLNDRKELLFTSGFGTERFLSCSKSGERAADGLTV